MRWIAGLLAWMISMQLLAQAPRYGDVSYQRPDDCSSITEQNRHNPFAYLIREHCEQTNAVMRQSVARIHGRPQPSRKVLVVPVHGSEESKRLGVACMGGLVMLRIENGWKQALDRDYRYYTCRER